MLTHVQYSTFMLYDCNIHLCTDSHLTHMNGAKFISPIYVLYDNIDIDIDICESYGILNVFWKISTMQR